MVRQSHEDRWATFVIEAAQAWGHTGPSFHDRKRHVVTFAGLGDVSLEDPEGWVARYAEEEQRNAMAARCHGLLAKHFQAPPEWITGDAELDQVIRRELISVREHPMSARSHAGVARLGRRLGIDGWEERWRWAADRYVADGTANRLASGLVCGILLWLEIGDTERVAATADLILRSFDPEGEEADLERVHETRLTEHVMAVWWRDGRAALASTVERPQGFGGNTRVEAFALAAVASETGLVDELREQLDRLEQMRRKSDREIGPHEVHDGHEIRHIVGVVHSWLAELDPSAVAQTAVETAAVQPRVSAPISAPGVTNLAWRCEVLVADGAAGTLAVDVDGRPVLAPPPSDDDARPRPSAERVRRVDDSLAMERHDGSTIVLRADWDEDQLEDAPNLDVTSSPSGDRFAVWGEYGRIAVFAPDGSPAGQFLDHWKGPTYGVELAGDRMMSWARDGRAVVYDLERRLVVGAVQMNGWPEGAALDASGRIVLTLDNVDSWLAHDIDTGERVGPTRPAVRAALHPTRPVVGYADDEQVWTETYEP